MITLTRIAYLPDRTLGVLDYNKGYRFCTLERPWIDNERRVSCVPEGMYLLRRDKEGKYIGNWELTNVPGRSEIIIHAGNKPEDVQGCILVGLSFDKFFNVRQSRDAIYELHQLTLGKEELPMVIRSYSVQDDPIPADLVP